VPAVVLFCLFYGVALQHVPEKAALLSVLEGIRLASLKFWNAVVRFAPLAVFALFADLAGTIRPRAMEEVSLFFFLFFAGALILTFWIVPGCIAAFTPFRHKEVLRDIKSALLISRSTDSTQRWPRQSGEARFPRASLRVRQDTAARAVISCRLRKNG